MILSGPEIRRQRELGNIVIDPWDDSLVNPNSVDLHLGDTLMTYDWEPRLEICDPSAPSVQWGGIIDSRKPPPVVEHPRLAMLRGAWLLTPGRLYLGATREYTECRGFVPYVDGRSSMGRLGLFCHVTAGRGDNGFCGTWTLELVVVEPLIIYVGQRIAQLTFHTIQGDQTFYGATDNSSGRYQDQRDPTSIRLDNQEQDE